MSPMKPLTLVAPSSEVDATHEAWDKDFALACRYSGGWGLVEEMVASECWPLGRNRSAMSIEMVNLPVFGEGVGVPFPRFSIMHMEAETIEDFTAIVE